MRSVLLDHCELLYGLLKAGLDPKSELACGAVGFVKNALRKKSWESDITLGGEVSRTYIWAVLALLSSGETPNSPDVKNCLEALNRFREKKKGWSLQIGKRSSMYDTAVAIITLREAETEAQQTNEAEDWLTSIQNYDGGWSFQPGGLSDYTPTAIGAFALSTSKKGGRSFAKKACDWLIERQMQSGRWRLSYETPIFFPLQENYYIHFTTPWAILALLAFSRDAESKPAELAIKNLLDLQDVSGGWSFISDKEAVLLWSRGMYLSTWASGQILWALGEYLRCLDSRKRGRRKSRP